MTRLSNADAALVATVRSEGIAVCADVLSTSQLDAAREAFDQLHAACSSAEALGRLRSGVGGDQLGTDPRLASVYAHPRIVGIVQAIMGCPETLPYCDALFINRTRPGCASTPWKLFFFVCCQALVSTAKSRCCSCSGADAGMRAHSDNGTTFAMPWEKIATMTFLDDDGALEFLPGSHFRHFLNDDGTQPSVQGATPPGPKGTEVREAHAAGGFIPVRVSAGSVVFRKLAKLARCLHYLLSQCVKWHHTVNTTY